MSETTSPSKAKTIYLAIPFFGGFTPLLIFYLIYKYFRMRRNDIEQRRAEEEREKIKKHNQLQRERYKKKQEHSVSQNVLTHSIVNWTQDSSLIREGACLRCGAYLNAKGSYANLEDIKEGGVYIFIFGKVDSGFVVVLLKGR